MPIQFDSANIVCSTPRRVYPVKELQEHTKNPPQKRLPYPQSIQANLERFLIGSRFFVAEGVSVENLEGYLYFWETTKKRTPARTISVPIQRRTVNGAAITTLQRREVYIDPQTYTLGTQPPQSIPAHIKIYGREEEFDVTLNFVQGGDRVWNVSETAPEDSKTEVNEQKLINYVRGNNGTIPLCFYWQLFKSQIETVINQ